MAVPVWIWSGSMHASVWMDTMVLTVKLVRLIYNLLDSPNHVFLYCMFSFSNYRS